MDFRNQLASWLFSEQFDKLLDPDVQQAHDPDAKFLLSLFKARSCLFVNKYEDAGNILTDLVNELRPDTAEYAQCKLWLIFTRLYIDDKTKISAAIKALDEAGKRFTENTLVTATISEVKGLILYFGIVTGLTSISKIEIVSRVLNKAAILYLKAGLIYEHIQVKLNAIGFQLKYSIDKPKEIEILAALLVAVEKDALPIQITKLQFLKMQHMFIWEHEMGRPKTIHSYLEEFEALENSLASTASSYRAEVVSQVGTLLLRFGYSQGINKIRLAIQLFKDFGDVAKCQGGWNTLNSWYMRLGSFQEADYCFAEVMALSEYVRLPVSVEIDVMRVMHHHMLTRDFGLAIKIAKTFLKNHRHNWITPQLRILYSNLLSQNKQHDEAKRQVSLAVKTYSRLKSSMHKAQALANYARHQIPLNDSISSLIQAIQTSRVIHDRIGEARNSYHLAEFLIKTPDKAFEYEGKIYRAEKCLSDAIELLRATPEFEAVVELGLALQAAGLYYWQINDRQTATSYLLKANEHFMFHGLKQHLSFACFHWANLHYETGANQGRKDLLDIARESYKNLEQLAVSMGQFEVQAMTYSLYARCLWTMMSFERDPQERENLHLEADLNFKRHAYFVNRLRSATDSGEIAESKMAAIHFGQDNQSGFRVAFYYYQQMEKFQDALECLEQMKSQTLHDSLSATVPKKENEYLSRLKALAKAKHNATPDEQASLDADIRNLISTAYQPLTEIEIDKFVQEKLRLFGTAKALLDSGEESITIVEYYYDKRWLYIFGIRRGWDAPLVSKVPFHAEKTEAVINHFSDYGKFGPASASGKVRELIQEQVSMIGPIEKWSKPGDLLYLIPFGVLHNFPLHAIRVGENHLIERNPIAYAPSLRVLCKILSTGSGINYTAETFAIFGNPTLDLPFSEKEAIEIGRRVNGKPFLRGRATKDRFLKAYEDSTVLHFAGHAKANPDDGFKQFLLVARNRKVSALELMARTSSVKLLVLSGCETGLSQNIFAGDETLGLKYAAIHSSAGTIISSMWRVADESTQELLALFYDALLDKGMSCATALQYAMQRMIADNKLVYDWAPFTLYGRWM